MAWVGCKGEGPMRRWNMWPWLLGSGCLLAAVSVQAGYLNDHFDTPPFTNGATFTTAVSNWMASTGSVVVTGAKYYSSPNSILLPAESAISNTVSVTPAAPSVVWTDLRIAPTLGAAPDPSAMNGVTWLSYFDANGYLQVWNGSAWLVCSNDVFNQAVPAMSTGAFATISIYQNYSTRKAAVLVNDRLVLQDLAFPVAASTYNAVGVISRDSSAWLDDAYVQTNYDAGRLTNDLNGVYGVDAGELQMYGYAARTLYVGGSSPYAYASLSNALGVARDRDTLNVTGASYGESVTITQNLTLAGSFTNSGTITVAAGEQVNVTGSFVSSLMVSGTLQLAQGVVVSGTTVTVAGTVAGLTNGARLIAGTLNLTGSGSVVATGGEVAAAGAGVDMTGTFTLNAGTWGLQAVAGLDFTDDFELYADNTPVQKLGFRGWGASSAGVLVQATQGYGSSKGVIIPDGCLISNRLTTVGQPKIWTDFHLKAVPGIAPAAPDTNQAAFVSYVATNGILQVWSAGAWLACTNYIDGSAVPAMSTGSYTRVTVFANFVTHKAAVFIEGKLSRELVGFPAGATIPSYTTLGVYNNDTTACLDDMRITTGVPVDLLAVTPATDLDGDGMADAQEIQVHDSVRFMPFGTVFKLQ